MRSASSTVAPHVLLDEQHRRAAAPDLRDRLEHLVDEDGREAERRLVEEQQPRLGDERAGDRELLLLAAGQRPRREARTSAAAPGTARARARARRPRAPGRGSRSCRAPGSRPRSASRRCAGPRRRARSRGGRSPRSRARRAARRGRRSRPPTAATRPTIAASVVDLPAPFGPTRPTISPSPTSRLSVLHGRRAAVPDRELTDAEHRPSAPVPR